MAYSSVDKILTVVSTSSPLWPSMACVKSQYYLGMKTTWFNSPISNFDQNMKKLLAGTKIEKASYL